MERHDSIDLSRIPSMTALLAAAEADARFRKTPRASLTPALRAVVDEVRTRAQTGTLNDASELDPQHILDAAVARVQRRQLARLRPVINATGIVLHTGLGRSPLSHDAIERLTKVASGYSNLELDLDTGERGLRGGHAEALLQELTGAEAALVVNNNAAATLLALCELAGGREVIVSRGQLIEIGGSYRLPDVMQAGGARLREVGTTNKTRLSDYERAITDATGLIMRVHTSNYRVVGFTAAPNTRSLCELAHRHGLLMYDDLGSGAICDDAMWTAADEPTVPQALRDGADLVSFSGDKLLGGPQAGILLGNRKVIDRLRGNPMARALRVGKLTLAALEATLERYLDAAGHSESSSEKTGGSRMRIPLLAALNEPITTLESRAARLASGLKQRVRSVDFSVMTEESFAGGGSLPAWPLPTACVRCVPRGNASVDDIARRLRVGATSVLCRIRDGAILFDVRTITDRDIDPLVAAVEKSLAPSIQ